MRDLKFIVLGFLAVITSVQTEATLKDNIPLSKAFQDASPVQREMAAEFMALLLDLNGFYLPMAKKYADVAGILGDSISAELRSGASGLLRNISSGIQNYETDPSLYPINKPVEKYEARIQCTGEAIYINDIPEIPGELHAAFVYSTVANCYLDTVDPSAALAMTGKGSYMSY